MSPRLLLIACATIDLVVQVHSLGKSTQCISVFAVEGINVEGLNEAFFMVADCPHSWPTEILAADGKSVVSHCESQDPALPPMTDTSTGLVYRNEYCAMCNNATQIRAWEVAIVCTVSVYLALSENSIETILLQDPDIFNTQCQACKYQPPPSTHPPQSCVPAIRSCLNKTVLERQLHPMSDATYRGMVLDCFRGEQNLTEDEKGRMFHNLACSDCNAVSRDEVRMSFALREREMPPSQCVPMNTPSPPLSSFEHTISSLDSTTTKPPGTISHPRTSTSASLPFTTTPTTRPADSPPADLPIIRPIGTIIGFPPPVAILPFTITLSGLGGGGVSITTETETYQVSMECPEGEVPVGLECRPTQCPQSYTEIGGRCIFSESSSPDLDSSSDNSNCSLRALERGEYVTLSNDSVLFQGEEVAIMGEDKEGNLLICINTSSNGSSQLFLDCPTGFLPLNETEFEELGNGTILYYNQTMEVMFYDDQGRPLVCPDNRSVVEVEVNRTVVRLLPGIVELTYIGCSLSVLGSALLLLTHALFRELRTFPSFLLINLSSAILLTNLLFIVGGPVVQQFPRVDLCIIVAVSLHFSYLAQFAWMSLFSFQMVHTFYLTRKMLVASERRGWGVPLVYMLIGWGLPMGITLLAVGLNFGQEGLVQYGVTDDGSVGSCWINHFLSFILLFLVPLLLSLTLNLIMFVTTSVFLCELSRSKSSSYTGHSNHVMLIRVWLAFFSITGLTWIFGFLAVPDETSWAWYPFVIFNSTQGFSIFLAFLLTKKTLILYTGLLTSRKSVRGVTPATGRSGSKTHLLSPQKMNTSPTMDVLETV